MKRAPANQQQLGESERKKQCRVDGYEDCEKLKRLISKGKYRLDCGHLVTLNHHFGNNIAVINGRELKIICTLCLY